MHTYFSDGFRPGFVSSGFYLRQWFVVAIAACLVVTSTASAMNAKQCNAKLYNTLYGDEPTQSELQTPDPLSQVDDMLKDTKFIDYFSSFVNAHMNWGPEDRIQDNPVYAMVRYHMFRRDLPWKSLFLDRVKVDDQNVNNYADGVGYFEDKEWKDRYAGNEEDGYRLRSAYMIMNNMIGLNLEAITVSATGGSSRADRQTPGSVCFHCHYRFDFALDKVANILTKVDRERSTMNGIVYTDQPESVSEVIYGETVTDIRSLATMLSERPEFYVNACNIAFEFVFGRESDGSDPEIFGQCVTKFKASGKIQDAIKHFVESDIFCQDLEV